ncbi:sulfate reduction electron transfer complex DsrMKJOP subunit DsrJ [Chloroflexota bacterium]
MRLDLINRNSRNRPNGLVEQIRSNRKLLILNLVLMTVIIILTLSMSGCTSPNYSTSFTTSGSTLCQSCHGTGEVAYVDEEKILEKEGKCVLPVNEQRDRHKDLLHDWKKSVVRDGNSVYVASDGQEYEMSLTGTCLGCHSNKVEFCDQCHSYAAVNPDCWNCHKLLEGDQ